ncbi:MAG: hypothetical protein BWY76_02256 [bacterium ADurb.Bin429]|nr:MAG: hypothetical protein BWY76_02256 [bacterium ADurb.Bin429]
MQQRLLAAVGGHLHIGSLHRSLVLIEQVNEQIYAMFPRRADGSGGEIRHRAIDPQTPLGGQFTANGVAQHYVIRAVGIGVLHQKQASRPRGGHRAAIDWLGLHGPALHAAVFLLRQIIQDDITLHVARAMSGKEGGYFAQFPVPHVIHTDAVMQPGMEFAVTVVEYERHAFRPKHDAALIGVPVRIVRTLTQVEFRFLRAISMSAQNRTESLVGVAGCGGWWHRFDGRV